MASSKRLKELPEEVKQCLIIDGAKAFHEANRILDEFHTNMRRVADPKNRELVLKVFSALEATYPLADDWLVYFEDPENPTPEERKKLLSRMLYAALDGTASEATLSKNPK